MSMPATSAKFNVRNVEGAEIFELTVEPRPSTQINKASQVFSELAHCSPPSLVAKRRGRI